MFDDLMIELACAYQLFAPDLPGFGASDPLHNDPARVGVPELSAAVHAFLGKLGIQACHVYGHHTGAAIAAQLAHDHPSLVARLAISGPPLMSEELRQRMAAMTLPVAIRADGAHLRDVWNRVRKKDPSACLQLSQREVLSALQAAAEYAHTPARVARHEFAALLPEIHCPTLVFAGDRDPLHGSVGPTAELLPCGEVVSLPGGLGTYLCDREPAMLGALLAAHFGNGSPKSH